MTGLRAVRVIFDDTWQYYHGPKGEREAFRRFLAERPRQVAWARKAVRGAEPGGFTPLLVVIGDWVREHVICRAVERALFGPEEN
jgi:hypothetical protein